MDNNIPSYTRTYLFLDLIIPSLFKSNNYTIIWLHDGKLNVVVTLLCLRGIIVNDWWWFAVVCFGFILLWIILWWSRRISFGGVCYEKDEDAHAVRLVLCRTSSNCTQNPSTRVNVHTSNHGTVLHTMNRSKKEEEFRH